MTFDPTATAAISPTLFDYLLAAGLTKEPSGSVLFHYTTGTGLAGIVADGAIFASDTRFFNDMSEYTYGTSLIAGPLDKLKAIGHDQIHAYITKKIHERGGYYVFAACYCEVEDLLSQWGEYGSSGSGYSLGIPWKNLSLDGKALLVPVTYGDTAVIQAATAVVDLGLSRLSGALSKGVAEAEAAYDAISNTVLSLFLIAMSSKQQIFDGEREYRLIHLIDREKLPDPNPIEFRPKNGILVPFVRLPLPKNASGRLALVSIRRGPSLRDASAETGVQMLLDRYSLAGVANLTSAAALRAK